MNDRTLREGKAYAIPVYFIYLKNALWWLTLNNHKSYFSCEKYRC
ncbi:hypothetical protein [Nostoc punctiforme]|nr:hypothetical protein [Nostoc punctiforme]